MNLNLSMDFNISKGVCQSYHTVASCYFVTIYNVVAGSTAVLTNCISLIILIPKCKAQSSTLLIINMALADFLTGVFMIAIAALTRHGFTWENDPFWMCMVGYTLAGVSLISVTLMSIDRFLVVRSSLKLLTPRRDLKLYLIGIFLTWIYTILFSSLRQLGILSRSLFIKMYFAPSIFICVAIATVCYANIYRALRDNSRQMQSVSVEFSSTSAQDLRLTKLFASIGAVLILLMMPQIIVKICFHMHHKEREMRIINDILNSISLSSSAVNPLLYCLFLRKAKWKSSLKNSITKYMRRNSAKVEQEGAMQRSGRRKNTIKVNNRL